MGEQVITKLLGSKYKHKAVALDGGVVQLGTSEGSAQIVCRVLDPLDSLH